MGFAHCPVNLRQGARGRSGNGFSRVQQCRRQFCRRTALMPIQQAHQAFCRPCPCPIVGRRQGDPKNVSDQGKRVPFVKRQQAQGPAAKISKEVVSGKLLQSKTLGFGKHYR